jgi:hypothetical protein
MRDRDAVGVQYDRKTVDASCDRKAVDSQNTGEVGPEDD